MSTNEILKDPILVDLPLPIRTERLELRPIQPGDGAALYEAKRETWDMLSEWMIWAKGLGTVEDAEIYARGKYADFIRRACLTMVGIERETGAHVIWTGLHSIDWEVRLFTIGYWVRKSAQRRCFATEGTNALIRYAFGALGARRVEIGHAEGNTPSQRVIERLGFRLESVRESRHPLPDGRIVGDYRYGLLSADALPPLDVEWGPP